MEEQQGAYLIAKNKSDTSTPLLFIFLKLSKAKLERAIPLSTYDKNTCEYLGAFFENGMDYIAAQTKESIQETLNESVHVNLLESSYESCMAIFPTLTREQHERQLTFSKRQLTK